MSEMLTKLRAMYDYIIIDTPPIGIVADGFEINKLSDVNIFIIRQEYTSHQMVRKIDALFKEKKLQNVSIVINDVKKSDSYSYEYGYGYGYQESNGYYEEDEKRNKLSLLKQALGFKKS
jgi:Mrp family chromosome partitioning ATPase